ncbi:hypothetical protein IG631_10372 [Alternaria alternata]|nr:hypothetical protein IG631_10372 [Alternaria alternata]
MMILDSSQGGGSGDTSRLAVKTKDASMQTAYTDGAFSVWRRSIRATLQSGRLSACAYRKRFRDTKVEIRDLMASRSIWKRETRRAMVAIAARDKVS